MGYSPPSSRPLLVPLELFKLFNHDCTNIACRCIQRSVLRLSPHPRILFPPQIWSIALGTLLRSVVFPTALYSVTADSGEYSLYAGGSDGRIFALSLQGSGSFDNETGGDGVLLGHTMAVTSLGVSSDGMTLMSGSEDGSAKVWDVNGRQLLRTLQQGKGERVFTPLGFDQRRRKTWKQTGIFLVCRECHCGDTVTEIFREKVHAFS